MSSEFENKKLREVIELVIDNRGKNPKEYSLDGIPVIDNYLITGDGEVNLKEVNRFIDEKTYNSFLRKHIQCGDVLMTLVGNGYGKVAITPKEICAIIQNTVGFRCNNENSNRFLYYLLRNNRETFMNLNRGAAQPSIKVGDILDLEFYFPPKEYQENISNTLGVLDDRISLLRETNATLEAIAQALFKSWFVDFDPVHARARGEQPAGLPPEVASLFPDCFEESELGMVPKGWRTGAFRDVCVRIESGGTPRRSVPEYWGGGVSWLSSGEVRSPIVFDTKETITDLGVKESAAKLWPQGTTVVAMYGATAGEVCLLARPTTANQACCGLIPKPQARAFMFMCARRERAALASKSSGSAQQNLNKGLIESHPLVLPPIELLSAYEESAGALLDCWIENDHQAQTLATLRDTLLPRLISGQLRLPDAEAMVSEAQA